MNEEMKEKVGLPELQPNGLDLNIDKCAFALALKTWRLRNGMTQKQLGERWGCSRFSIIRAERAKNISWEVAYRMFARLSEELRKEALQMRERA